MHTIEAKNITGATVAINNLDVPNAQILAGQTVNLTNTNSIAAIQSDIELKSLIESNKVVLVLDSNELTKEESEALIETTLPGIASANIVNPIDTGNIFAGDHEKYIYKEGTFADALTLASGATWLINVEGGVKDTSGNVYHIGQDNGTDIAKVYIDTLGNIKTSASGAFLNQDFKVKITYI